ncbi:MAG: dolichyl-phosphate beta-glucosyltransferase [Methanoregulaceae archaeon]
MTQDQRPDCTLVIPAYNEESRIQGLISSLAEFPGEIIFVCDGTDSTADILEEYSRAHPYVRLKCLRFAKRLGKGGGIREGLLASGSGYVGFMDADGSTPLSEMTMLFGRLTEVDCAIGSRWVSGSEIPVRQGILRRVESRTFNLLIRVLFGLSFKDTQCGAKAIRKSAVDAVLPEIRSRGFEFDVELLWHLNRKGYTIREYPIRWENRTDSRVKSSDILKMLAGLFTIRLRG